MALVAQYDAEGFFAGLVEDYDGPLPNGADRLSPPETLADGAPIPAYHRFRRTGPGAFELVEDHRGREGWLGGEPHTISAWGPLPEGWTATLPPPSLEKARAEALQALKQKRQEEEKAGPFVAVDGEVIRFPSDIKDETRLNTLAALFAAEPGMVVPGWKVSDGVYLTMTAPLLESVMKAGFNHASAAFAVERAKAAELAACATTDDVAAWLATELDSGWPGLEQAATA